MDDHIITQPTFDPNTTYIGTCTDNTRVYWTSGNRAAVPTCDGSNNNWFNLTALKCKAAVDSFTSSTGYFTGKAARYESRSTKSAYRTWVDFDGNDAATRSQNVECQTDRGVHGDGVDNSKLYARNSNGNAWGSSGNEINWNSRTTYRIYSINYINWWNDHRVSSKSKLEIVKDVSKSLIDSVSGVNLGLMRYSNNDSGQ